MTQARAGSAYITKMIWHPGDSESAPKGPTCGVGAAYLPGYGWNEGHGNRAAAGKQALRRIIFIRWSVFPPRVPTQDWPAAHDWGAGESDD